MHIDGSQPRQVKKPARENLTIRHRHQKIAPERFEKRTVFFRTNLGRLIDRNPRLLRKDFYRRRLSVETATRGTIRLRDDGAHFESAVHQRAKRRQGEIRRPQENHAHGFTNCRTWPVS